MRGVSDNQDFGLSIRGSQCASDNEDLYFVCRKASVTVEVSGNPEIWVGEDCRLVLRSGADILY